MSGEPADGVDIDAEAERLYEEAREHYRHSFSRTGYSPLYAEVKRFKAQLRADVERIVAAARATKE